MLSAPDGQSEAGRTLKRPFHQIQSPGGLRGGLRWPLAGRPAAGKGMGLRTRSVQHVTDTQGSEDILHTYLGTFPRLKRPTSRQEVTSALQAGSDVITRRGTCAPWAEAGSSLQVRVVRNFTFLCEMPSPQNRLSG